jgi:hypothetical protein
MQSRLEHRLERRLERNIAMTRLPASAVNDFQLQDTQTSGRGAKTATLLGCNGSKVMYSIGAGGAPTCTPFGASTYNDEATARKTLDLRVDDEEAEFFQSLDTWAIEYLSKNSERLFKKAMTPEQVQEHYRSPVATKEGYQPLVRTKINTSGPNAVRCWDAQRDVTELPEDLRGCQLLAHVHLSHLWIMGRDFGWVFTVHDLMIVEQVSQECPFD